ncbi:MAG: redox-sensing transcriptional repressor Rex, partial [Oscillibacter sp.]|nr:redox-sensing transcriptional repressor Rex [Oscillibacter sp.]
MRKENISDAVIRRLPRYYRQLSDLSARGITRI